MIRKLMQFFAFVGMAAVCAAQTRGAATKPVGWRTYNSPDYEFTIEYPGNGSFTAGYRIEPQGTMMPVCDDTSVACFKYIGHALDDTVVVSQGVSVNILRDRKAEDDCNDIERVDGPVTSVVIHGARFHHGEFSGAAGGRGERVSSYRAFHQAVCFEITLVTVQAGVGREQYEEEGLHPVDKKALRAVQNEMNRILHSFTFTSQPRKKPSWNIYVHSLCGGSFEFPAGAKIHDEAPLTCVTSFSTPTTRGATCEQSFTARGRVYTIAEKVDFHNPDEINEWLTASALPGIGRATNVDNRILVYRSSDLAYLVIRGQLFFFSLEDTTGNSSSVHHDLLFERLVKSFRYP
jgi:hypothetical protein